MIKSVEFVNNVTLFDGENWQVCGSWNLGDFEGMTVNWSSGRGSGMEFWVCDDEYLTFVPLSAILSIEEDFRAND